MKTMKEWTFEVAAALGLAHPASVHYYMRLGYIRYPRVRRINRKIVYVLDQGFERRRPRDPRPGEIPLKQWVQTEAGRRGVTPGAIYNQLIRSQYRGLRVRRLGKRTAFIKCL